MTASGHVSGIVPDHAGAAFAGGASVGVLSELATSVSASFRGRWRQSEGLKQRSPGSLQAHPGLLVVIDDANPARVQRSWTCETPSGYEFDCHES